MPRPPQRSHVVAAVGLCLTVSACYASHGTDDIGPVDARHVDASVVGLDAARPPVDTGPFIFMDGRPPLDTPFCACASDADCPPPPPSWNCLAPFCATDCTCTYRLEPARCEPEGMCQPTGECVLRERPDAAFTRADAFVTPVDAFVAPRDAFVVRRDAFVVPADAFTVPVDAFVPPIDAFVPPGRDAGRPPSSDALRFTSGQAMTVPHRPSLSVGPDLTLELWARLRSPGVIAIKGDPVSGSNLYLELRAGADGSFRTLLLGWTSSSASSIVEIDHPITFDLWTHFALVQRGTPAGRVEVELYVDGESVAGAIDAGDTMSYVASFTSSAFVIGRTEMDVDEVRLWRVARRQAAIQGFMRTELAPGVSGLVAYWPLDGVGQVVLDRSLNGNDGFRGNSPAEDGADPTWIPDGAF